MNYPDLLEQQAEDMCLTLHGLWRLAETTSTPVDAVAQHVLLSGILMRLRTADSYYVGRPRQVAA